MSGFGRELAAGYAVSRKMGMSSMDSQSPLHGVGVGAGYFSHYHYDAWRRIDGAEITAIVDLDPQKAESVASRFGIPRTYGNVEQMLDTEQPDFIDIITPPSTHAELCRLAGSRGIHIICQKPLAPTYAKSVQIIDTAREAGVRLMVHENWRWQPWYREIKQLIEDGELGEVFSVSFVTRTGDGWGDDAYLERQPFFREYPRLLVYETGVHFIDAFRYLLGEIESVYARLRRLNPVIKGEDSGQLVFGFRSGATAIWDSNRYNESRADNPRFTFGECRVDGSKGHLELASNGDIFVKPLGQAGYKHEYTCSREGFAGDCVHRLQSHFVACVRGDAPFEASAGDYLVNIRIVDACYESADSGDVVRF